MLIECSISNFRSIYDTQTLSMVANTDQCLMDSHCIATKINAIPLLLNSAAVYGPNASGKSNLISAIGLMRDMIKLSATNMTEGQLLPFLPFRFQPKAASKPSEFEVHFIEGNIRYQYGFAFTKERIIHEWLFAYKSRKGQRWFERKFNIEKKEYDWYINSKNFPGSSAQYDAWKNTTRKNALFLSNAVRLNCEQLMPVFSWFNNKFPIIQGSKLIPATSNTEPVSTIEFIKQEKNKLAVLEFLQVADLGITDIKVETKKVKRVGFKIQSENMQIVPPEEVDMTTVTFFHGNTEFEFNEESHGTQRLFHYVGFFLDVLKYGKILLIDELESGLHPTLSKFLIKLFHNKKLNRNKAQLIFSTHDTSLLNNDLFRRDQIWFMEKDRDNSSRLYPLTDFSPRRDEALEKGYLQGRYGALPFFGELEFGK